MKYLDFQYDHETWYRILDRGFIRAKVLCSDGKCRLTRRIARYSDSYYTVPCTVQVKNMTVSGYMYIDDNTLRFQATGKNRNKLPEWQVVTCYEEAEGWDQD